MKSGSSTYQIAESHTTTCTVQTTTQGTLTSTTYSSIYLFSVTYTCTSASIYWNINSSFDESFWKKFGSSVTIRNSFWRFKTYNLEVSRSTSSVYSSWLYSSNNASTSGSFIQSYNNYFSLPRLGVSCRLTVNCTNVTWPLDNKTLWFSTSAVIGTNWNTAYRGASGTIRKSSVFRASYNFYLGYSYTADVQTTVESTTTTN